MVDPVIRIQFEVCEKKNYQRKALDFCVKNPIKGDDGKEDFPDEDI